MEKKRDLTRGLVYFLCTFILVFSPLPIGSVESWSRYLLLAVSFLTLTLWLFKVLRGEERIIAGKGSLPLLAFMGLCLFQILPLPGFILSILSEKSLYIWRDNLKALSTIGHPKEEHFFTISIYPHTTWIHTLELFGYVSFGFLVSWVVRTRKDIKRVLIPVLGIAILESIYGIYQYAGGHRGLASGTFVNHNHFAGLLEMSIPLALGYTLSMGSLRGGKGESILRRVASEEVFQKQMLMLFIFSLTLLALILSGSRMGIFSQGFALIFFYLAYIGTKRERAHRGWMILLVLTIALLYGLWIGLYQVVERFLKIEEDAPIRTLVWRDMLSIVKDFPLFGSGFGTFSHIYPLYKKHMEAPLRYIYAHNDWLQLIAETGIAGFLLVTAALLNFFSSSFKALSLFSKKGDEFYFFILLGALSGIVSILIHSLADFNLHIPSNAFYFAFLFGLTGAIMRSVR